MRGMRAGTTKFSFGSVLAFRCRPQPEQSRPLVFYKSKYRALDPEIKIDPPPEVDVWCMVGEECRRGLCSTSNTFASLPTIFRLA